MVIIISGPPGAGKSSVSKALAEKFPKSAHISIDQLRDMIIGGNIAPWEEGAAEQYELIEKNFLDMTKNFLKKGFVVIIDDVISDEQVKKYQSLFEDVYGFLLLPSKETLRQRELGRDPNGELLERIEILHPRFANSEHDILKLIDSTNQTLEETVNEIFSKFNI